MDYVLKKQSVFSAVMIVMGAIQVYLYASGFHESVFSVLLGGSFLVAGSVYGVDVLKKRRKPRRPDGAANS